VECHSRLVLLRGIFFISPPPCSLFLYVVNIELKYSELLGMWPIAKSALLESRFCSSVCAFCERVSIKFYFDNFRWNDGLRLLSLYTANRDSLVKVTVSVLNICGSIVGKDL
jgi:hypothetical protein